MIDSDTIYHGEPAPRRRGVAVVLTLLMPGLGHVYAGRFAEGLVRYLVPFFGTLSVFILWRWLLFQPHIPLLVLAAAGAVYQANLVREVWSITGPIAKDYTLRGFNHPMVYGALLVLCHLGPVGLLAERTTEDLLSVGSVREGGMFPMLFIGDRVLVDHSAYRSHPPRRGDLVTLREPNTDKVIFRRVGAIPGDDIRIEGTRAVVNGAPLERTELGFLSIQGLDNLGHPADVRLHGFRERNGSKDYVVTFAPQDGKRPDLDALTVPPETWYVLADNRDGGPDSRQYGPVPGEAILGRPLYVWWSEKPDGSATIWHRIGLAAR